MRLLRVFSVNSAWKACEGRQLPPLGVPGAVSSPAGTGEEEEEAERHRAAVLLRVGSQLGLPRWIRVQPECLAGGVGRSLTLLPVGFIALGKPGGWRLPGAHRLTECVMVV